MKLTKKYLTDLIYRVNGSAIAVHNELGPGLLESIYHAAMIEELKSKNINFTVEHPVKVMNKGKLIKDNLRVDLLVEKILPIHEAQLFTYMRLLKAPEGLLINFM